MAYIYDGVKDIVIKLVIAIVIIGVLALLSEMCGCKPVDITSPTPTMMRYEMEYESNSFTTGTLELEIPYSDVIVSRMEIRFEREDISAEPYTVLAGTFSDTVQVNDDVYTKVLYEKMNLSCTTITIYSDNSFKIYVWMVCYEI